MSALTLLLLGPGTDQYVVDASSSSGSSIPSRCPLETVWLFRLSNPKPPDGNCAVSCIDHCLKSKNYVNLIVGSKNPGPNWLDPDDAEQHCRAGASVWSKFSTDGGKDPDVVLVGAGVEVSYASGNLGPALTESLDNYRSCPCRAAVEREGSRNSRESCEHCW